MVRRPEGPGKLSVARWAEDRLNHIRALRNVQTPEGTSRASSQNSQQRATSPVTDLVH
jgi:hypothetical protein